MRRFLSFAFLLLPVALLCQTITQRLQKAWQQFESDSQLKHAISSLYVIDAKTGQVVFDKNSQIGLAPASTQKIITSVTAFELLGKDYRYKTELGYTGEVKDGSLNGSIIISGNGDPTFGSPRYSGTIDTVIFRKWTSAIARMGIHGYDNVFVYEKDYSANNIPDGWIWQDIGNYYGAGTHGLNWRENQYDIFLKSDSDLGGEVYITRTEPDYMAKYPFYNTLKSGEKGSGDNAYIYLKNGYYGISGTIPRGEKEFRISGTMINPGNDFKYEFMGALLRKKMRAQEEGEALTYRGQMPETTYFDYKIIEIHYSPTLDSIIYWFNKKSINLYGEALIKTFAYEKQGLGSTDSGVAILKKFWKDKGIDEDELNMYDGSGLSPLNRVTTHAQVEILKYAKTKDWFPAFYHSLPEYNGMKIKSGTISDVKGFCGYHKAKDGREYIFSFLVNNYSGKASVLVPKMYKILDVLK